MNRFEYREAHTVEEAVWLAAEEEDTCFVAGATDMLIRWRQGNLKPKFVINIRSIPDLDNVSFSPEYGLSLGALVTIRTLECHPLIQTHYPALTQAASAFAGVQIRHLATVGGNVCNASPAGDSLPALLAYGAECRIVGPDGERHLPLDRFFLGPGQTALRAGELLLELRLPPPPPHSGALYIKHSPRHSMDIATAGVVSVVSLDSDGEVVQAVKIALGAVAPTVIRVPAAEAFLTGRQFDPDVLRQAAVLAGEAASPIDDIRGTATHRKAIIAPLARRTLHYAAQMARGTPFSFRTQRRLAVEAMF